ncbi:AEC family transporter [Sinorhizobium meliloti]|uniref:AEC family transporter n=1 Tax=Rhizobium meliloti TaxID=382 RepID=UPI0002FE1392|nr:AEC family transporter [Sinorhizobium meliloti]ASJ58914.1 transporter [Sinorhizobium meliloti]ASP70783.1 transporter [Sinorhizobium meliloti]MCO5963358.1 AEC family transporter [Sinorhizobium meliloti]MDE4544810.1 AEC family transporter [Sinorhizobium meliloti]MDE4574167.1 AEC family transporter [Sinorhizobium meliloti]
MTIVFESILPVFLLVILGVALRRSTLVDQGLWIGLEQFGYYFLFPALLFSTLAKADLAGLEADATAVATVGSVTLMSAALLSAWPLLRRGGISGPTFTSVFQTATRWNAFIALAVAEKLFGTAGLSLTALVMALLIIPINFYNIAVLTWFGGGSRGIGFFFLKIITNPLIISSALGILFNLTDIELYEPVMTAVDMLASASLGLGLILVGAGLKIADALNPSIPVLFAVVLKLIVMPVFMVGSSALLGIRGDALLVIAVGAAVPTAMNGYLLAKQMGGDAELYASVATIQTAASFLTIPLVLFVTGYVAAG